jgi:hypothetical protein
MFNPSRDQARQFIIDAWAKRRARSPATPMETLTADLVEIHPEYHNLLGAEDALQRDWTPEQGETNPFLHLSLHMAIEEQLSIDQPPGIRAAFDQLCSRKERHEALHHVLEALGETLFNAQRNGTPPDSDAYLERIRRQL